MHSRLAALVLVVGAAACGPPGHGSVFVGEGEAEAEAEGEVVYDGPPLPPQVTRPPSVWHYPSLPISGTAPAGSLILVRGGANPSGDLRQADSGAGSFCINVRLNLGVQNTLSITSQNAAGEESSAVTVTVLQQQNLEANDPPAAPLVQVGSNINIAGDAAQILCSDSEETTETLRRAVDGSYDTGVDMEFWDPKLWGAGCDAYAFYLLRFDSPREVDRVSLTWGDIWGNTYYPTSYKVLASTSEAISTPSPESDLWTTLHDRGCETTVQGTEYEDILLDQSTGLRQIAVLMYEDPYTGIQSELFNLMEIEVWSPEVVGPGDAPASDPSCENGLGY